MNSFRSYIYYNINEGLTTANDLIRKFVAYKEFIIVLCKAHSFPYSSPNTNIENPANFASSNQLNENVASLKKTHKTLLRTLLILQPIE
jgi:hypothetical protein